MSTGWPLARSFLSVGSDGQRKCRETPQRLASFLNFQFDTQPARWQTYWLAQISTGNACRLSVRSAVSERLWNLPLRLHQHCWQFCFGVRTSISSKLDEGPRTITVHWGPGCSNTIVNNNTYWQRKRKRVDFRWKERAWFLALSSCGVHAVLLAVGTVVAAWAPDGAVGVPNLQQLHDVWLGQAGYTYWWNLHRQCSRWSLLVVLQIESQIVFRTRIPEIISVLSQRSKDYCSRWGGRRSEAKRRAVFRENWDTASNKLALCCLRVGLWRRPFHHSVCHF